MFYVTASNIVQSLFQLLPLINCQKISAVTQEYGTDSGNIIYRNYALEIRKSMSAFGKSGHSKLLYIYSDPEMLP